MDSLTTKHILKYIKKCDLYVLKKIKNLILHFYIVCLDYKIFSIDESNIDEIKNLYYLYDITIKEEYFKEVAEKIKLKGFKKLFEIKIVSSNLCYSNADLALISFFNLKVEVLDLKYSKLSDSIFEYLQNFDLTNLRVLNTINNVLKFLKHLKLESLIVLDLSDSTILCDDLEYLIDLKLENLKKLNFNYTKITDRGLKYLKKCKFQKLTELSLSKTKITNKSLKTLKNLNFPNLKTLDLTYTKISFNPNEFSLNCEIWL